MTSYPVYDPGVLVRVGATADEAIGGLFLVPLGSIATKSGRLCTDLEIQNAYSLPQRPAWVAPVASIVSRTRIMKGKASALYGMTGGGDQYFIAPGQSQPAASFFAPVRLTASAMTLSVKINGSHHKFDAQPDGTCNIFPFLEYPQLVERGSNRVSIELGFKSDVDFRQIYLHDRFGNQEAILHVFTCARVAVADNCCSYSVDGAIRFCVAKIWRISSGADGDLVVLHPKFAPHPQLNTYRFNKNGTLRWQLGSRQFNPNDRIFSSDFLANGNVRIRAWDNLWSAEVDDSNGSIVRIIDTNER